MRSQISLFTLFCFLMASIVGPVPISFASFTQEVHLPKPGVMVHLSAPVTPPLLKGIKVHLDNPFRFDFILDPGYGSIADAHNLRQESNRLIKYFLASLTVPEADLWVNLSPYEKDRIVPESFGQTEMGRDLLVQDYMLKQITASLIYPEDEVGRRFWKRIYEESAKRYGTTNIPVNTFNKVWILPEKAVVYENSKAGTAYVVESRLKVMLEEDYLSMDKNTLSSLPVRQAGPKASVEDPGINELDARQKHSDMTNKLGSQIIREIVIPELTKEINEGSNFSQLRQVYSSLILATWYKKKIKDSILAQVYSDKNKVQGININDPQEKDKIYQQYLQAFKKGVYNYIKEEKDLSTQQPVSRKYFSGGAELIDVDAAMTILHHVSSEQLGRQENLIEVSSRFEAMRPEEIRNTDPAMLTELKSPVWVHHQLTWFSLSHVNGVLRSINYLEKSQQESHRDNYEKYLDNIKKFGKLFDALAYAPVRIDTAIENQGESINQGAAEIISNAIDAVLEKQGHPAIGRFGVGFYMILSELEQEGDRVQVLTKNGKNQTRFIEFMKYDDQVFVRWEILPKESEKGTKVRVIKSSFNKERTEQLIDYLKGRFARNTNLNIQIVHADGRKEMMNERKGLIGLDKRSIGIKFPQEKVVMRFLKDGYEIQDDGKGMADKVIFDNFLIPRATTKPMPQEEDHEVKVFYKPSTKENQKTIKAKINVQINGQIISSFEKTGYNLPEEFLLELSPLSWIPESRNKIRLTKEQVISVIEQILEKSSGQERAQLLNAFALILRKIQDEVSTDIIQLAINQVRPWIKRQKSQGKIILPNEPGFFEFDMDQKNAIYLNPVLFDFNPADVPSMQHIKEYDSESVMLYVADFDSKSKLISFEHEGYVFINKTYYEAHKDNAAPIDLWLDSIRTGYRTHGEPPKKGSFHASSKLSLPLKKKTMADKLSFSHALLDEIRKSLSEFLKSMPQDNRLIWMSKLEQLWKNLSDSPGFDLNRFINGILRFSKNEEQRSYKIENLKNTSWGSDPIVANGYVYFLKKGTYGKDPVIVKMDTKGKIKEIKVDGLHSDGFLGVTLDGLLIFSQNSHRSKSWREFVDLVLVKENGKKKVLEVGVNHEFPFGILAMNGHSLFGEEIVVTKKAIYASGTTNSLYDPIEDGLVKVDFEGHSEFINLSQLGYTRPVPYHYVDGRLFVSVVSKDERQCVLIINESGKILKEVPLTEKIRSAVFGSQYHNNVVDLHGDVYFALRDTVKRLDSNGEIKDLNFGKSFDLGKDSKIPEEDAAIEDIFVYKQEVYVALGRGFLEYGEKHQKYLFRRYDFYKLDAAGNFEKIWSIELKELTRVLPTRAGMLIVYNDSRELYDKLGVIEEIVNHEGRVSSLGVPYEGIQIDVITRFLEEHSRFVRQNRDLTNRFYVNLAYQKDFNLLQSDQTLTALYFLPKNMLKYRNAQLIRDFSAFIKDKSFDNLKQFASILQRLDGRIKSTVDAEALLKRWIDLYESLHKRKSGLDSFFEMMNEFGQSLLEEETLPEFAKYLSQDIVLYAKYLRGELEGLLQDKELSFEIPQKTNFTIQDLDVAKVNIAYRSLPQIRNYKSLKTYANALGELSSKADLRSAEREIISAISGQDRSDNIWTRELVQNSRDAIKTAKGHPVSKKITIDNFVRKGTNEWIVRVSDSVGMDLPTLIGPLFVVGESTKIDVLLAGFFGEGFYTIFAEYDRVNIKTSDGNGKTYYLTIGKNTRGLPVIQQMSETNEQFKGTIIERVVRFEKDRPNLESIFVVQDLIRYVGAIQGVDIIYNGKKINEDLEIMARVTTPFKGDISLSITSASGHRRITQEGLYIEHLEKWILKYVPGKYRYLLTLRGLNIDLPRGVPVTRARIGIAMAEKYRETIQRYVARAALQAVVRNYIRHGVMVPGVSDDYFSYEKGDYSISKDIYRDAQLINENQMQGIDFSRYVITDNDSESEKVRKNRNLEYLVTLIEVEEKGKILSLQSIREELWRKKDEFIRSLEKKLEFSQAFLDDMTLGNALRKSKEKKSLRIDIPDSVVGQIKSLGLYKFLLDQMVGLVAEKPVTIKFYYDEDDPAKAYFVRRSNQMYWNLFCNLDDIKVFIDILNNKENKTGAFSFFKDTLNLVTHELAHQDEPDGPTHQQEQIDDSKKKELPHWVDDEELEAIAGTFAYRQRLVMADYLYALEKGNWQQLISALPKGLIKQTKNIKDLRFFINSSKKRTATEVTEEDEAMNTPSKNSALTVNTPIIAGSTNTGGIDFTTNKIPLDIQNRRESIKFHLDPAMLYQLQDAPGFAPVIISMQPMTNVRNFLGISDPSLNN